MKFTSKPVEVDANQISGIGAIEADGSQTLQIVIDNKDENGDTQFAEVFANASLVANHKPTIGDFWIVQPDGEIYILSKSHFFERFDFVESTPVLDANASYDHLTLKPVEPVAAVKADGEPA